VDLPVVVEKKRWPDLRSPPRPFDYLTSICVPAFPSPSGLIPPFWVVELRLEPLTPCRHGSLAHNVEVARKLLLICYHFQYQITQSVFERFDCHLPVNSSAVNGIEKLLKKAIDLLHFTRCPGHDRFAFASAALKFPVARCTLVTLGRTTQHFVTAVK
jgi:hypothetical protein